MPKFDITVQLTGNDGNAFAIMAAVKKAIVTAGATPQQVTQYTMDSMSGDYDNLLRTAMEWVEVE
jgi:ribosomal protein S9